MVSLLFRADVSRYRVLLTRDPGPDPLRELDAERVPELRALTLHNGTVWRWNRPCYGIAEGVPHLRVENRVLPSGPSIPDEIANAARIVTSSDSSLQRLESASRSPASEAASTRLSRCARLSTFLGAGAFSLSALDAAASPVVDTSSSMVILNKLK